MADAKECRRRALRCAALAQTTGSARVRELLIELTKIWLKMAVEIERDGQVSEPLAETADVLLVAQRLIEEVRRERDEGNQRRDAIEKIHANSWKMRALR